MQIILQCIVYVVHPKIDEKIIPRRFLFPKILQFHAFSSRWEGSCSPCLPGPKLPPKSHDPAPGWLVQELCNSEEVTFLRCSASCYLSPSVWSSCAPGSLGMALENCELLPEIKKIRPTVLATGMERTWNPPLRHLHGSQNSCSVSNTTSILHFYKWGAAYC